MSPIYKSGDRLIVHPDRGPVSAGDDLLISRPLKDGSREGLIKHLVRVTPKAWQVRRFNPEQVSTLSRKKWPKAELVIGRFCR